MRPFATIAIVSCCALAALPSAAAAMTFQAERGAKLRGQAVKRGNTVLLQGPATISRTLRTPALLRVEVLARARPCRGWPRMRISLDGRTVALVRVRSRRWRSYGRLRTARSGLHKVVVRFLDPRRTASCRRAIAVDSVTLAARRLPPAAPPPAPPPPPPAAATTPPPTFVNPVYTGPAGGGFADPTVLDVGGNHNDYWAYATGGLFLVASSTDLVHWRDRGSAMTSRPPWTDQTGQWNPWAPSVIETRDPCPGAPGGHCFVMYFVSVNRAVDPDVNCIGVATSTSPGGPFTDRGPLEDQTGAVDQSDRPLGCGDDAGYSNIDPAPFVDEDGTPYLYFSTGHRCDVPAPNAECPWARALSVVQLSDDLLSAIGPRQPLLSGGEAWDQGVVENPWPTRAGDDYELLYSGGNFQHTYGMGYAAAAAPTGAFAKAPVNPILTDSAQVLSAGGGALVTSAGGEPWVAYHGRAGGYDQARTLRLDRLQRRDDGTLAVEGPSTAPQPVP
jgi:hypothetical protein